MKVIKRLFRPSSVEIWRELNDQIGAKFVEGDFWNRDKVEVAHGGWTVTLDTYFSAAVKHEYTCLRATFHNPDKFRFTVYRRGLFSDIAKRFGMQDVEVGHADFDRDFIIQGTDEQKLRALFESQTLRKLIAAQPEIHFTMLPARSSKTGHAADRDELCFSAVGVIRSLDRLRQLFDLMTETLDQLCRIRSGDVSSLS